MKTVERLASLMQHLHLDVHASPHRSWATLLILRRSSPSGSPDLCSRYMPTTISLRPRLQLRAAFLRSNVGWRDDARKLEGAQMAVPHALDSLLLPTSCWTNVAGIVKKLDDDIRDWLRMRHSCHDMGAAAVCGHQSAKGTHPQRSP
jgi:hypothetical protein